MTPLYIVLAIAWLIAAGFTPAGMVFVIASIAVAFFHTKWKKESILKLRTLGSLKQSTIICQSVMTRRQI